MVSKVIKCVAGAGKTTYSEEYMNEHKNGIYNKEKKTIINLNIKNGELHLMNNFTNSQFIKYSNLK